MLQRPKLFSCLLMCCAWIGPAGAQINLEDNVRLFLYQGLEDPTASGFQHSMTYVSGNVTESKVADTLAGLASSPQVSLFFSGTPFNGTQTGLSAAWVSHLDRLVIRQGFGVGSVTVEAEIQHLQPDFSIQTQTLDLDRPGLATEAAFVTQDGSGFNVVSRHRNLANGQQVIYDRRYTLQPVPFGGNTLVLADEGQVGTASVNVAVEDLNVAVAPGGNILVTWSEVPSSSGTITSRAAYVGSSAGALSTTQTTTFNNLASTQPVFSPNGDLVMGGETFNATHGFVPQLFVLESNPALAPTNASVYTPLSPPGRGSPTVAACGRPGGRQVFDLYTTDLVGDIGSLSHMLFTPDGRVISPRRHLAGGQDISFNDPSAGSDPNAQKSVVAWNQFNLNTGVSDAFALEFDQPVVNAGPGGAKVIFWIDDGATTTTDPTEAMDQFVQTGGTASYADRPDDPGNTALQFTSPGDASMSWKVDPLTFENIQEIDDGDQFVMQFDLVTDQAFIDNDAKFRLSFFAGAVVGGRELEFTKTVTGAELDPLTRSAQFILQFPTTGNVWILNTNLSVVAELLVDDDPTIWLDNLAFWVQPGLDPADLDFDGDVDDADFGIAFAAFTGPNNGPSSNPDADLDGDGDVDDADFGIAFAAFTGPGPANVPEPASLALLGLGGLLSATRRRGR